MGWYRVFRGHSRLLELASFDRAFYSDYVPILHEFWNTARYWRTSQILTVSGHQTLISPHLWHQETRVSVLFYGIVSMILCLAISVNTNSRQMDSQRATTYTILAQHHTVKTDHSSSSNSSRQSSNKLECGPMPNVMAALPNVGGAFSSTHKFWVMPTTRMPCSNAAKKRNLLKFVGVPQTRQQISAASEPKFTILWGQVVETLLFNEFFPIADMCLSCEDIARESCAMVPRWRIFGVLHFHQAACSTFQTCILNSH